MKARKAKGIVVVFAGLVGIGLALANFVPDFIVSSSARAQSTVGPDDVRAAAAAPELRVFAFNDLGMHCYDHNFSVFSLLPLFNVLRAQVILAGDLPKVLTKADVKVYYKALADASGSINTTSMGKTNFWRFVGQLYGANNLPRDVGLLGASMPGAGNTRRRLTSFDPAMNWFGAVGIPITTYDDSGARNSYPLMSVKAVDPVAHKVVADLPVVLPVSDEMSCFRCHATGAVAAQITAVNWSTAKNKYVQYTENILLLHDFINGTDLYNNKPILCASCHYSKALDLNNAGPPQNGHLYLSRAVHWWHAGEIPDTPGSPNACYNCHPGSATRCLRGVMAKSGLVCVDCHGTMSDVASVDREPWADEPKCQSCHTGDAVSHRGGSIRLRRAYRVNNPAATPRMASNKRFAENPDPLNPRKALLYRNSLGHGGVACEACHGSPHAEWPANEPNDNLAAMRLQGHTGTITECTVCHVANQPANMGGPHGMHNVNSSNWVNGHAVFFGTGTDCITCHGLSGEGTVLSRTPVSRTFTLPPALGGGNKTIRARAKVACGLCHANPIVP